MTAKYEKEQDYTYLSSQLRQIRQEFTKQATEEWFPFGRELYFRHAIESAHQGNLDHMLQSC